MAKLQLAVLGLGLAACGGAPCDLERREYAMPAMPPDGLCVALLAPEGAYFAQPGTEDACGGETPLGACTLVFPWQIRDGVAADYFVTEGAGEPRAAIVSCEARSCSAIADEVLTRQGEE